MNDTRPLTYDPPARASVELPGGKWGTRPWEPGEKAAYWEANRVRLPVHLSKEK